MAEPGNSNGEISADILIPDLLRAHPQVRPVLDRYGLRGCGGPLGPYETLAFFARAHEINEQQLLVEINAAITTGTCCPPAAATEIEHIHPALSVADMIYRRFFVAGIIVMLTLGATWGAALLWRIGLHGSFADIPFQEINAHAQAQVFGWMGFFIMGFGYQAFPRFWHTNLANPKLAVATFWMMVLGLVAGVIGQGLAGRVGIAPALATTGGSLELAAVACFAAQIAVTFVRSGRAFEPYIAFILTALFWFVTSAVLNLSHIWATTTATTLENLVRWLAVWQPVLRDIQFHGLGIAMILGVSLRTLPHLFGLPKVPSRSSWTALALVTAGVVLELTLLPVSRLTGNPLLASALILPWLLILTGCLIAIWPWKLWQPFPSYDRSAKFIRAAYGWLIISLLMLLISPAYLAVAHMSFSHAYFGAIRHAITVGFISLMITGYAAKVVPVLNGVDSRRLTALWGPFLLINFGCSLRVLVQTLTDWYPAIFPAIGISGTLEVAGFAWWGVHLLAVMRGGLKTAEEPVLDRPAAITADHRVACVLDWYPETEEVFLEYGFAAIANPIARKTVARTVTLTQACAMHDVPLKEFLRSLNLAIGATRAAEPASKSSQ